MESPTKRESSISLNFNGAIEESGVISKFSKNIDLNIVKSSISNNSSSPEKIKRLVKKASSFFGSDNDNRNKDQDLSQILGVKLSKFIPSPSRPEERDVKLDLSHISDNIKASVFNNEMSKEVKNNLQIPKRRSVIKSNSAQQIPLSVVKPRKSSLFLKSENKDLKGITPDIRKLNPK